MTPYPTPDALWMIILSLGHLIMYVPIRNLIQCMGDKALMSKICEKYPILGVYFMIFGSLTLQWPWNDLEIALIDLKWPSILFKML